VEGSPLTLRGDEVVQPEFTIDLLQPKVDGVVVKLGLRHAVGGDRGGKPRELSLGLAPTTASLTRGIWDQLVLM
jgi:hypothetical protein